MVCRDGVGVGMGMRACIWDDGVLVCGGVQWPGVGFRDRGGVGTLLAFWLARRCAVGQDSSKWGGAVLYGAVVWATWRCDGAHVRRVVRVFGRCVGLCSAWIIVAKRVTVRWCCYRLLGVGARGAVGARRGGCISGLVYGPCERGSIVSDGYRIQHAQQSRAQGSRA